MEFTARAWQDAVKSMVSQLYLNGENEIPEEYKKISNFQPLDNKEFKDMEKKLYGRNGGNLINMDVKKTDYILPNKTK